jgi:hypothetical protein
MTAGGLTWTYFGEGWNTYVTDPGGTDTYDRYCNICNPFQYASDIMTSPSEIDAHIQDTSSFFSDVTAILCRRFRSLSRMDSSMATRHRRRKTYLKDS